MNKKMLLKHFFKKPYCCHRNKLQNMPGSRDATTWHA
jgi:hypothetical protein